MYKCLHASVCLSIYHHHQEREKNTQIWQNGEIWVKNIKELFVFSTQLFYKFEIIKKLKKKMSGSNWLSSLIKVTSALRRSSLASWATAGRAGLALARRSIWHDLSRAALTAQFGVLDWTGAGAASEGGRETGRYTFLEVSAVSRHEGSSAPCLWSGGLLCWCGTSTRPIGPSVPTKCPPPVPAGPGANVLQVGGEVEGTSPPAGHPGSSCRCENTYGFPRPY